MKPRRLGFSPRTLYTRDKQAGLLRDFFTADTETAKRKKKGKNLELIWTKEARPENFIFGVIYGHNFQKEYHSREEMVYDIQHNPKFYNKNIFLHNTGKFDNHVLFDNIYFFDSKAIHVGSRFICASTGNGPKGRIADSINIFKTSIKELGKMVGVEKIGMSDDYGTSVWPKDRAKDINGCVVDCQILWLALFEIFQKVGVIKITIGSLALAYYRSQHQPFHLDSHILADKFFDSYYGGRNEVFKQGKVNCVMYDVVSTYAYSMLNALPNPLFLKEEVSVDKKIFLTQILNSYEGCIYCTVNHPALTFGCLPYRSEGKLLFPDGKFSGCWNFPEIRFAISKGVKILHIEKVVYGEAMKSPFISFVDTLIEEKIVAKAKGEKLLEAIAKSLLVNLYGKMGQRNDEQTEYIADIEDFYPIIKAYQDQHRLIRFIPFSAERNDCQIVVKTPEAKQPRHCIASIPSYITSYSRVHLLKKLYEWERFKPAYCDTDSIALQIDPQLEGIQSSEYLGGWSREKKIITYITTLKQYRYAFPKSIYKEKPKNVINELDDFYEFNRCKGVPSNAVFDPGKAVYTFENLVGAKEALKRNMKAGSIIQRTKNPTGKYTKRIVFEDGTTKPITIK